MGQCSRSGCGGRRQRASGTCRLAREDDGLTLVDVALSDSAKAILAAGLDAAPGARPAPRPRPAAAS